MSNGTSTKKLKLYDSGAKILSSEVNNLSDQDNLTKEELISQIKSKQEIIYKQKSDIIELEYRLQREKEDYYEYSAEKDILSMKIDNLNQFMSDDEKFSLIDISDDKVQQVNDDLDDCMKRVKKIKMNISANLSNFLDSYQLSNNKLKHKKNETNKMVEDQMLTSICNQGGKLEEVIKLLRENLDEKQKNISELDEYKLTLKDQFKKQELINYRLSKEIQDLDEEYFNLYDAKDKLCVSLTDGNTSIFLRVERHLLIFQGTEVILSKRNACIVDKISTCYKSSEELEQELRERSGDGITLDDPNAEASLDMPKHDKCCIM